jgi:hypothetical protein
MALMVVVLLTVIGLLYKVPVVSLGMLPSVVYLMDAPEVAVLMVTACVEVYVPAAGVKVAAATVPVMVWALPG